MTESGTPILIYGRHDAQRRQRLRRRLLVIGVLFALLIASYPLVYDPLKGKYDQFMFLRQQNQLRNNVQAPDIVVYSDDPAEAAQLQGVTRYQRSEQPIDILNLKMNDAPSFILREHRDFDLIWNRSYMDQVFRGSRFTPSGVERILGTTIFVETFGGHGRILSLSTTLMAPRTAIGQPSITQSRALRILLKPTDHITILAGQRDPKDAGRFVIPYQLNGVAGTFEGQLTSPTEVKMRVYDGFADVPSFAWEQAMATLEQEHFKPQRNALP